MEELQAGTGARDQTRAKDEIAIGATRARGPQLLAAAYLQRCSLELEFLSATGNYLRIAGKPEISVIREGLPTTQPE